MPHTITCAGAAPYTGTGSVDAAFPFTNAIAGGTSKDQNPYFGTYWKMSGGTHCWLILDDPYYIPEVILFGKYGKT
jgi:hypothetical protein